MDKQELRDKIIDNILKVAMAHHDDISEQDEYAASISADSILSLLPPTPSCLGEEGIEKILDSAEMSIDVNKLNGMNMGELVEIIKKDFVKALTGKIISAGRNAGGELAPQGLHITCDFCHTKLIEPGALLFGIPNEKEIQYVSKKHLCKFCYAKLTVPGNTKPKEKLLVPDKFMGYTITELRKIIDFSVMKGYQPQEKFPKQFKISACCNSSVIIMNHIGGTKSYICQACKRSCDLAEYNQPQEHQPHCKFPLHDCSCKISKPQEVSNINPEIGFIGNINSKPQEEFEIDENKLKTELDLPQDTINFLECVKYLRKEYKLSLKDATFAMGFIKGKISKPQEVFYPDSIHPLQENPQDKICQYGKINGCPIKPEETGGSHHSTCKCLECRLQIYINRSQKTEPNRRD